MADKAISDLTEALQIFSGDWFVLQQGSEAKKLNGNTLKQYIAQIEINKIESVTFDAQGRCHIVLTDGTQIVSQSLVGPQGETGPQGATGPQGETGPQGATGEAAPTITNIAIDANYHLIVTLSNGTSYDAGYCRGASGAGAGDMLAEVYDPENGARQVAFKDSVVPNTAYNPSAKTAEMTQEVGKDSNGKLWTNPAPQGNFLPLSGGTMTGNIAMGGNAITGLATPTNDADAVNVQYVIDRIKNGKAFTKEIARVTLKSLQGNLVHADLSEPLTNFDILIFDWMIQPTDGMTAIFVDSGASSQLVEVFEMASASHWNYETAIYVKGASGRYYQALIVSYCQMFSGSLPYATSNLYITSVATGSYEIFGSDSTIVIGCSQGGTSTNNNNRLKIGGIKL